MMEPFLPHPPHDEEIAAADAGAGAPEPAPGFGIGGEEPDRPAAEDDPAEGSAAPDDVPFRTPDPDEVGRTD
jgi:hypothetical protein